MLLYTTIVDSFDKDSFLVTGNAFLPIDISSSIFPLLVNILSRCTNLSTCSVFSQLFTPFSLSNMVILIFDTFISSSIYFVPTYSHFNACYKSLCFSASVENDVHIYVPKQHTSKVNPKLSIYYIYVIILKLVKRDSLNSPC